MEKSKVLFEREILVEMANLGPDKTGFDHGILYISTEQGNHGARVKYYRKAGKTQPYAGFSIEQEPRLLYDDLKLKQQEKEEVVEFIKLNREDLLTFWYNADTWESDKVYGFLKRFKKIK